MALRRADGAAEFTIANTGPGIPPEISAARFRPLLSRRPGARQRVDGCGLGLSIAQWIVSAHHGDIHIESVPSKLTTVTVHLPLLAESKNA